MDVLPVFVWTWIDIPIITSGNGRDNCDFVFIFDFYVSDFVRFLYDGRRGRVCVCKGDDMTGQKTRRAFTLIELLVVVAIIAILVSLLMPSLARARVAAIRTGCLNNMRSTMASMHLYASDYGEFPVNIDPDTWNDNWIAPGSSEWLAPGGDPSNYAYWGHYGNWPVLRFGHGSDGVPSHWRGHLIYGKYGNPLTLGCSRPLPPNAYLHSGQQNWHEGSGKDLATAPAYVYMGPGVDLVRASDYYMGISVTTRQWRSYRMASTPIFGESSFFFGYDTPRADMRSLHNHKHYFGSDPETGATGGHAYWYARPIDMSIGWTDGHAESHTRLRIPKGYYYFNHNWNQKIQ